MAELRHDLLNHWTDVIRTEFDPAYEFSPVAGLEYQGLRIARLLPIEGRPSRGSRQISLRISWASVDGYQEAYDDRRAIADERLRQFVAWKLKGFDPDHDTEFGDTPPQEAWWVDSDMLLGRAHPVFE